MRRFERYEGESWLESGKWSDKCESAMRYTVVSRKECEAEGIDPDTMEGRRELAEAIFGLCTLSVGTMPGAFFWYTPIVKEYGKRVLLIQHGGWNV